MSYQLDIGHNLSSADGTLTSVEGMRDFGCANKFWKLVIWQCTPVFVIERDGWGTTRDPLGYESAVPSVLRGMYI